MVKGVAGRRTRDLSAEFIENEWILISRGIFSNWKIYRDFFARDRRSLSRNHSSRLPTCSTVRHLFAVVAATVEYVLKTGRRVVRRGEGAARGGGEQKPRRKRAAC